MKRLPVDNSYIYNELLDESIPLSSYKVSYDGIHQACEEQLIAISTFYGLGGAVSE